MQARDARALSKTQTRAQASAIALDDAGLSLAALVASQTGAQSIAVTQLDTQRETLSSLRCAVEPTASLAVCFSASGAAVWASATACFVMRRDADPHRLAAPQGATILAFAPRVFPAIDLEFSLVFESGRDRVGRGR